MSSMNVLDAAYALVHDYQGWAPALGPRVGLTGKMLSNKVCPTDAIHKLTLDEAVRISEMARNPAILHAFAERLGFVAIPTAEMADADDIGHAIATVASEFGDYVRIVDAAVADGKVTPRELREAQAELVELIAAATQLQGMIAARSRAGARKP